MSAEHLVFVEVWVSGLKGRVFTYGLHSHPGEHLMGKRVVVPVKRQMRFGIILKVADTPEFSYKMIQELLPGKAVIQQEQLSFFNWIAKYYLCSLGEVLEMALPSKLGIESKERYQLGEGEILANIPDAWVLVQDALEIEIELSKEEILLVLAEEVGAKKQFHDMVSEEFIVPKVTYYEAFKAKKQNFIRADSSWLNTLKRDDFQVFARAPKQKEILEYLQVCSQGEASYHTLVNQKGMSASALRTLIGKNIVSRIEKIVPRTFSFPPLDISQPVQEGNNLLAGNTTHGYQPLFHHQGNILQWLDALVHTCSSVLKKGKDVLILVPDMLLFPLYYSYFRSKHLSLLPFNPLISPYEKAEIWNTIADPSSEPRICIAGKEGVLLPFKDLGLIVVDQEGDELYKRRHEAPFFHGRDCAFVLAKEHNCTLLLSAEFPSMEVEYLHKQGKLQYLNSLTKNKKEPVSLDIVNMEDAYAKGAVVAHLAKETLQSIHTVLQRGKQSLLFREKRGYALKLVCTACGEAAHCDHCSTALTLHKKDHVLKCHTCMKRYRVSYFCGECNSATRIAVGFGTEQLWENIQQLFPQAKVEKLDRESILGKKKLFDFIDRFDQREIDILVGTRMLTKGVDLRETELFGVVTFDELIAFPDFRLEEQVLLFFRQILRRMEVQNPGSRLLIQTRNPEQRIIKALQDGVGREILESFLSEREQFGLPPYSRQITVEVAHRLDTKVTEASTLAYQFLSDRLGKEYVLAPLVPSLERVRGKLRRYILCTFPKTEDEVLGQRKYHILSCAQAIYSQRGLSGVRVSVDVDPLQWM